MVSTQITPHYTQTARGGIFHLACGPEDGPAIVFLHGWPELAISWRHQLPVLGALGFRAIAMDMPGFGRSVSYSSFADYALEKLVGDCLAFLDALKIDRAVWVGHDMGSPLAWSIASHHPERCHGVASLCVPYRTVECGFEALLETIDRSIYAEDEHPYGHWDYMKFYEENFDKAAAFFEADPANFFKTMFTRADPSAAGKPLITAGVRERRGWFGDIPAPPPAEMDPAIVDETSLAIYVSEYERTGFRGPDSHYMNSTANAEYTGRAVGGGRLDMPALFLMAEHDHWCECIRGTFADQMRSHCPDLTSVAISAGHWLAQEAPVEVNSALVNWLATRVGLWPALPAPGWD